MIKFFFTFDGQMITLPVNPQELEIKKDGNNKTVDIVKLGEVNLLRTPNLASLIIESFFPTLSDAPYVLTKNDFEPPEFYIEFFENIIKQKKPVEFSISDIKVSDRKNLMSIESFTYKREASDQDVNFTLELLEYRSFGASAGQISIGAGPAGKVTTLDKRETTKVQAKTYTVAAGDTLVKIAQSQLGDSSRYMEIAQINNLSNPNKINNGQVLVLP